MVKLTYVGRYQWYPLLACVKNSSEESVAIFLHLCHIKSNLQPIDSESLEFSLPPRVVTRSGHVANCTVSSSTFFYIVVKPTTG